MLHTTINPIDDLVDTATSISNTMCIIARAEQIVDVLMYMGNMSADLENETQLQAIAQLLVDAQHELFKGLLCTEH